MISNNDIKYHIDQKTRTIIAEVSGTSYDAIHFFRNSLKRKGMVHTSGRGDIWSIHRYMMPNYFQAKAKYNPDDPFPYSLEAGILIAKRKLYLKYDRAYHKAIKALTDDIISVAAEVSNNTTSVEQMIDRNIKYLTEEAHANV